MEPSLKVYRHFNPSRTKPSYDFPLCCFSGMETYHGSDISYTLNRKRLWICYSHRDSLAKVLRDEDEAEEDHKESKRRRVVISEFDSVRRYNKRLKEEQERQDFYQYDHHLNRKLDSQIKRNKPVKFDGEYLYFLSDTYGWVRLWV